MCKRLIRMEDFHDKEVINFYSSSSFIYCNESKPIFNGKHSIVWNVQLTNPTGDTMFILKRINISSVVTTLLKRKYKSSAKECILSYSEILKNMESIRSSFIVRYIKHWVEISNSVVDSHEQLIDDRKETYLFILMEYANGSSLKSCSGDKLNVERIFFQLSRALSMLQSKVQLANYYKDLKSENILQRLHKNGADFWLLKAPSIISVCECRDVIYDSVSLFERKSELVYALGVIFLEQVFKFKQGSLSREDDFNTFISALEKHKNPSALIRRSVVSSAWVDLIISMLNKDSEKRPSLEEITKRTFCRRAFSLKSSTSFVSIFGAGKRKHSWVSRMQSISEF